MFAIDAMVDPSAHTLNVVTQVDLERIKRLILHRRCACLHVQVLAAGSAAAPPTQGTTHHSQLVMRPP